MTKEGRSKLVCVKRLQNGVIDRFTVVTSDKEKSDVKSMYQSMGYDVKEDTNW